MDKFNTFASQAKAKAEQGRVAALNRVDQARHKPSNSTSSTHDTSNPSSGPPTPPSRSRAGSSAAATPPSSFPRSSSAAAASSTSKGNVFVGIDETEKQAFFSLLDEYFAARPQYKQLVKEGKAPLPTASSLPITLPLTTTTTARAAPPKPPARTTTAPKGIGTATAMFDFDAGEAEDLGLKEGDVVTILEHVSDEWLRGELRGQTGIFPKAYVQMN